MMIRPLHLVLLLFCLGIALPVGAAQEYRCSPTSPDADGPFYRSGAPVRNRIGKGYTLTGEVKSAIDCSKIGHARIEIWMAGPDGIYGDDWRATLFSRPNGRYYFSTHIPGRYGSRPLHIHLIVNAPGFHELITQHYMTEGAPAGRFDLVLIPVSEPLRK